MERVVVQEIMLPTPKIQFLGKRTGSLTCLVQTFERAGTNLGRDSLR